MSSSRNLRTLKYLAGITAVPSIPILYWTYWSRDERDRHFQEVIEKRQNKVPNVQTLDDVLMDHVLPGDIVLFDRRCHFCQSPLAALACMVSRKFLTSTSEEESLLDNLRYRGNQNHIIGNFDHVGIVVPNPHDILKDPYLLEYSPQEGVVARPLMERVELSRSRSVLLLPLSMPGERRDPSLNDNSQSETDQSKIIRDKMNQRLHQFRESSIHISKKNGFANMHSTLSIFGALAYAIDIHESFSFLPVNPSAFLAVSALQEAGIALNVEQRSALNAKTEDFLRDHRFEEKDCVRLRPGFRFMKPLAVRENSN